MHRKLRLAHRILATDTDVFLWACPSGQTSTPRDAIETTKRCLRQNIPILIADRVVDYINEEKITGTLPKNDNEMPPCPTPSKACFVEWNYPQHIVNRGGWQQGGAIIFLVTPDCARTFDAMRHAREQYGDRAQAIYIIWFFSTAPDGRPTLVSDFEVALDKEARPLGHRFIDATTLDLQCDLEFLTVMHALAFFRCESSSVVNVTREEGPPSIWCKQRGIPELTYYALMIDGNTIRELGGRTASERGAGVSVNGQGTQECPRHFSERTG
jgi:hypothetical protein